MAGSGDGLLLWARLAPGCAACACGSVDDRRRRLLGVCQRRVHGAVRRCAQPRGSPACCWMRCRGSRPGRCGCRPPGVGVGLVVQAAHVPVVRGAPGRPVRALQLRRVGLEVRHRRPSWWRAGGSAVRDSSSCRWSGSGRGRGTGVRRRALCCPGRPGPHRRCHRRSAHVAQRAGLDHQPAQELRRAGRRGVDAVAGAGTVQIVGERCGALGRAAGGAHQQVGQDADHAGARTSRR